MPVTHILSYLCNSIDRRLHHYMETSMQVNSQINFGPILAMQLEAIHHRYWINMEIMTWTACFIITTEKKNGNTKNGNTKTNEKNNHPVCVGTVYEAVKRIIYWLKFFLGTTIDHLASSDEDEPIINLNHLGHDAENEGLYPFRRSSSSQYQRVSCIDIEIEMNAK